MDHNHGAPLKYECPVCHGTGYETVLEKVAGYEYPLELAQPCTKCKGRRRIQDATGVPPQFHDVDLSRFGFDSYSRDIGGLKKIAEDFLKNYQERWKKSGEGIYLWSETPGSGKTYLSCCIGKSVMIKHDIQMRFITVPDYLAKVGESYKRQPGEYDESEVYRECDLLIFDDLGTQKNGEWQLQEMFRIINKRANEDKITIFTSNKPPEGLNLDKRTIGRIINKSIVLRMPEESIRDRKAKEKQETFLRGIL